MSRVVPRDELAPLLATHRAKGRRVVLANGCFELLHAGHVRYLEAARALGDVLVVAINADASVARLKGAGRPVVPLADRAEVLAGLRAVDYVVPFAEETLAETLRALVPDVHAKGTDYTAESVPEAELDRALGIAVAICGDPKERSSTGLVERIARCAPAAEERSEPG
jgi:rfaE bifunctional protein nucleotidyltransferase chain/domain